MGAALSIDLPPVIPSQAVLQAELDDLNNSLRVATNAGDTAAAASFRSQILAVTALLSQVNAKANAADQPGAVATALESFSESVPKAVGAVASEVSSVVTSVLGGLWPVLVIGGVALGVYLFWPSLRKAVNR